VEFVKRPVSPHPGDPNNPSSLSGLAPILGASLVSLPTGLGARTFLGLTQLPGGIMICENCGFKAPRDKVPMY